MLKAFSYERKEMTDFYKKCRKMSEGAHSFAKYECEKLEKVVTHDMIL